MYNPNFDFENIFWKKGFKIVGGCDEVGRGAFAGPVVAGCVVFDKNQLMTYNLKLVNIRRRCEFSHKEKGSDPKGSKRVGPLVLIDDSKKLTTHQRLIADKWIRINCLTWGIGIASVAEINRKGITKAGASAFRRAVSEAGSRLGTRVQFLLIDAFYIPYIDKIPLPFKNTKQKNLRTEELKNIKISGGQLAIIKGDEKSFSIASSSIIAKVYRDKLMTSLSKKSKYKKYGWDKNKGYGTKFHRDAIVKYGESKLHRKLYIKTFLRKRGY